MAKQIPLTQGKFTVVDDEDYDWAMRWKWYAKRDKNTWYAVRNEGKGASRRQVYLHREIMKAPPGVQVDHEDRDGLNNRKENTRLATHAQNQQNKGVHANNKCGYKGVRWHGITGKWMARITINRKLTYLGLFDDPVEAAAAYDSAARKHHKQFAYQNLDSGHEDPNDNE